MNNHIVANLTGTRVSAIVFILDYLQIQLDGSVLTFMEFPKIKDADGLYSFGDADYRNKICQLIDRNIFSVRLVENEMFCLIFDNETSVFCSLKPEDYNLPEMVIYDGNNQTVVF